MRKLSIYRLLAAYGLLLVLALPMGMQALHPWLDSHQARAHCDDAGGQIHLHDQSYAIDHCFLCTFHFSQYQYPEIPAVIQKTGWIADDLPSMQEPVWLSRRYAFRPTRAPPAAA